MSATILGFEGQAGADFHVMWGAAAVQVGDDIVNPTTGLRLPLGNTEVLRLDGAITAFDVPIEVADAQPDDPIIVVAVNINSRFRNFLVVEQNRLGAILAKTTRGDLIVSVLRNAEGLEQYAADTTKRVLSWLFEADEHDGSLELIRAALALDPRNAWLNALRVHLSPNSAGLERLSRASTRERDRVAFDDCLKALRCEHEEYILKYEGGAAEGGGFDSDIAAKLFKAITVVTDLLGKVRVDGLGFLRPAPPPRILALQPGSAALRMVPELAGRKLGERVARYMELYALGRALEGHSPEQLLSSKRYLDALNIVAGPTLNTTLHHKLLDSDELHEVKLRKPRENAGEQDEEFSLLAVVTGALTDAERLEVRIFPGPKGRLMLPTNTNGKGKVPAGLKFLTTGKVDLHRLARLRLLRRTDDSGNEKIYLLHIQEVKKDTRIRITAIPSSIIRGQYRISQFAANLDAKRHLHLGAFVVSLSFSSSREGSVAWLVSYYAACAELETSKELGWARVPKPPKVTTRAKVLWCLLNLGGSALAKDLAQEVTRRYGQVIRVNNTRREVIQSSNTGLMRFYGPENKYVELLEAGRYWIQAYVNVALSSLSDVSSSPAGDDEDSDPLAWPEA